MSSISEYREFLWNNKEKIVGGKFFYIVLPTYTAIRCFFKFKYGKETSTSNKVVNVLLNVLLNLVIAGCIYQQRQELDSKQSFLEAVPYQELKKHMTELADRTTKSALESLCLLGIASVELIDLVIRNIGKSFKKDAANTEKDAANTQEKTKT